MLLALSLEGALGPWIRGPLELQDKWRSFLDHQSLVIARARGAFLSHWFGPSVPLEGLSVQVALANLTAVAARARAIAAPGGAGPWDRPNLVEPLAGMAGMTAGMFAAPLNSLLLGVAVAHAFPKWWAILIAGVNVLTGGALGSVALLVAGAAGTGLLALVGLAGRRTSPLVGFLGSVAAVARPAAGLWSQLTGPRAAVRNPVLREILGVFDSLAALLPHLFGMVALLVREAVPRLPVFAALADYARACITVVVEAFGTISDELLEVVGGHSPLRTLRRVLGMVANLLGGFATLLQKAWSTVGDTMKFLADEFSAGLASWRGAITPVIDGALARVVGPVQGASAAFATIGDVFHRLFPPGPPSSPGLVMRALRAGLSLVTGPPGPPRPPFPSFSGAGAVIAPLEWLGHLPPVAPPPLAPDVSIALARMAQPPRVIGGALAARAARPAGSVPPAVSLTELDAYLTVARRLVPPVLEGAFTSLQQALVELEPRTAEAKGKPRHPVLAVAPTQDLRLSVGELKVRLPEAHKPESKPWSACLRRAMVMHTITVPSPPAAAAARPTGGHGS
jgi:hypothetical protein